ncbi:MAG: hypothetical protein K2X38_00335 [Gemmataceae bacterium]|nr:hypothetical protein [Gemmataceae bacterium]
MKMRCVKASKYLAFSLGGAVVWLSLGCSPSLPPKADVKQCREALTRALDAWVAGQSPAQFKLQVPAVDFSDPTWDRGGKLVRYQIVNEQSVGVSARFTVDLAVAEKGPERKRTISYNADVGSIIVVRPDF